MMDDRTEHAIRFPAEVTFKSIFVNRSSLPDSVRGILNESSIPGDIQSKESRNKKFISLTVTGHFSSKENLDSICTRISSIEGFIMMF